MPACITRPDGSSRAVAAHRVLKLAERHDLLIIEDDIFGDLEGDPAPRYAAMDGLERVIVIGSFSKTLSAAFRTGYVALRPDWIEDFTDFRIASRFGGNQLTEAAGACRALRQRLSQAP